MKIAVLFCLFVASYAAPSGKGLVSSNPWDTFEYGIELDVVGKYWMFWTLDDEAQIITFEVHVEALGYVGFGISPNGGMTGSDVVIGWVLDDGTAVFHDRHAIGNSEPLIDESQDVTLLAATQNETHTILRFSRPYVTCDVDDREITGDTLRIIYSYADTDPEDITGLNYHGPTNRGTKSVVLLTYNDDGQTLPDDAVSLDIVISENTVPQKRTTYWCEYLRIPPVEQMQHVVMFEPLIKPGNEGIVHHIVLYICTGDLHDQAEGFAWDCIENIMPNQYACNSVIFVWAVGGTAFYFPEHTGFPFYSPQNDPLFLRMEMHYDNPSGIEGIVDSSGLRLHMTPTLREQEIGIFEFGATVSPNMMLPPHFPAMDYRGYGMPRCLQDGMQDTPAMNVFAAYQHSHLLGRKMRTRIFRDGVELEPLLTDENYDFNFQETRMFKEERIVYSTDQLVLDCIYDTTGEETLTTGGFATNDEMCVTFLYYYPKTALQYALTLPPPIQIIHAVEGIEIELTPETPFFRITAPPEYENKTTFEVFSSLDWTDENLRNRYQDLLLQSNVPMTSTCIQSDGNFTMPWWEYVPELGEEWVDPDDGQCELRMKKHK